MELEWIRIGLWLGYNKLCEVRLGLYEARVGLWRCYQYVISSTWILVVGKMMLNISTYLCLLNNIAVEELQCCLVELPTDVFIEEGLDWDGVIEGVIEVVIKGVIEELIEGVIEVVIKGVIEELIEGVIEVVTKGVIEELIEGVIEGVIEVVIKGVIEELIEGVIEGVIDGIIEVVTEGDCDDIVFNSSRREL